MAKRFLTPINLYSNTSDPATGSDGEIYFNTSSDVLKIYYNSAWREIQGTSGGASVEISDTPPSSPTTGMIWYESDTGNTFLYYDSTWVQINSSGIPDIDDLLPTQAGNSGKFLTTNGTISSWSTVDADKLDSQDGSYYLDWTNTTNKPDPTITLGGDLSGSITLTDLAGGTLTATVADDSHNHTTSTITNFTEDVQDVVGGMVTGNTESGISVTYDDETGKLNFDVNDPSISLTGDVTGTATMTNLGNVSIETTIAANSVALGDDTTGNYVATIEGTANQIAVSGAGTEGRAATLSFPSAVTFPGTVTLNADPGQALEAATKQYVDAIAQGLHIHASVQTATTTNISDLASPPASIDGVTLTNNMRVLVKNQSTTSQNGIYVYSSSTGALSRVSDFDSSTEIQGGDFVFVTGGTQNDNTGWVQTEIVTTLGTDPILWQQFSGAGTYTAGTGLELNGTVFSNTGVLSVNGSTGTITNIAATTGKLSQFASTTSSELAGVISDETGTGALVFANSPTFTGTVILPTSASGGASVRIPHGTTPSSPTDGDIWTTTLGLFARINGTSQQYAPLSSPTFTGTVAVNGVLDISELRESVVDVTLSSNVATLDWTAGNVYYIATAPTANMTFNVTNLPTDNSKIMTVGVIVTQDATGRIPSTFQIGGASQTIKWVGGSAPTPTSGAGKIDIFTFTIQRTSAGAWIVYGTSSLGF